MFRAGEALVGAVFGVGVFGLPFAFVQAGFTVGLSYLFVLGAVFIALLLMYSEVVLATPGRHQMSGYVKRYFGKTWGGVAALVNVCASWGALIAYILVGGEFAHALLSPWLGGNVFLYQLVFMIAGFLVALRGLALVARAESYLVAFLILVVLLLGVGGVQNIHVPHLMDVAPASVFLPYGVVLFSFGGLGLIPELRDVLGKHSRDLRRVIPWSYVAVIALYTIFTATVVGVSGASTTPEAIEGLGAILGPWALAVGGIMGFLAVVTSFFLIAVSTQDLLELDYGFTRLLAWFTTLLVPSVLFLLGARNFIEVMGFTGAVFGGTTAIIVVALYLRVQSRPGRRSKDMFHVPRPLSYAIIGIFVLGVILQLLRDILISV